MPEAMDLQSFVSETLEAIVKGVSKSQESQDLGEYIGPIFPFELDHRKDIRGVIQQGDRNYTVVEFDIAISSSEGLSGGGGVKVVGFFDAGAKGEQSSGTTSRVRFSVPILLPRAKST